MQSYTLLLDDVMEEHTQALFLCVSVCVWLEREEWFEGSDRKSSR